MKKIIPLVVISALLAISFAAPAAADDVEPTVINCTCNVWSTYVEDFAIWVDSGMRRDGENRTQFYHEASKMVAEREREAYISGLINAYAAVYSLTKNEIYNLPYRVGQYEIELDVYAKDPKNTDIPIAVAILILNEQLRKK
jgi:hypothetical protein